MATYDFKCTNQECGTEIEDTASMNDYKEHHPKCPECGSSCDYLWKPYAPQAILKDGPSGSWPSKGERFKNYRAKRSEEMGRRQKERYGHIRTDAVPNYEGKETGTWQEAQFQAMKEKGAESAATFNDKVAKEKAADKKIVV